MGTLSAWSGRTDLCVSSVFRAGKTRAAAALIAGLMIMEPSLNIMVMTKENTAAKAFMDHLLSLGLPESVYSRAGRIVGYLESKKGASHQTKLDIQQEKRNDVLAQKKLLIGCGGGFQQAAQFNCLIFWCGDRKQTPGGLRNTTEAKQSRRKLLSRPLGLRCDTDYIRPHLLCDVVARFAVGPAGSMVIMWATYLRGEAAVETLSSKVANYLAEVPDEQIPVYKVALAAFYLARRRGEIVIPIASSLNEAAGTVGIHRWNLILPSSARVSLLTYQTVIGVRYNELVKLCEGEYCFGRLFSDLSAKRGGFLPILWDAPKSDTYAVQDIGMLTTFMVASSSLTNQKTIWRSYTTRTDWYMPLAEAGGFMIA